MFYAKNAPPVAGAQWTGIVTQIAIEMLRSETVEAVVCVQSDANDRFTPKPIVAFSVEDIIAAKGVKPTLSPNLNTLATIEALNVKRLLFIGVGCQVQALRSIEKHLDLDKLYVLGTNCVDNGHRSGLEKFLNVASESPETVLHYEFMQDFRVHIKHQDGHFEYIPFFSLPSNELNDVIAQSCYSCFDYTNGAADLVVGYMGVPYEGVDMTNHNQYVTIRNPKGQEMFDLVSDRMIKSPTVSIGDRRASVMQTVEADDQGKLGKARDPVPKWIGQILAWFVEKLSPKGIEFAKFSIDYHYIRNYLFINRNWSSQNRVDQHLPEYAKRIVSEYNANSEIDRKIKQTI